MRALAIGLLCAACSGDARPTLESVEGVEELDQALADLTSQCTYVSGTLTLALEAGDIALFARTAAGAITINGFACGSATAASTTSIVVSDASSGAQTVILDLRGGMLGASRGMTPGLVVDLGGGSDEFKLIGSATADRITLGALGLSLDANTSLDVALANVEDITITLDDGADVASAAGDAVTGAAYASALRLYGGNGADTLRGGAGADTYFGGADDDTFLAGADADSGDVVYGGAGKDTYDASARGAPLAIALGDGANDGEMNENDDVTSDGEVVRGGMVADTLSAGATGATLYGGPGNDTLAGGGGSDKLFGEAGDDNFVAGTGPNGADTFDGGAGSDTISYAGRNAAVRIALDGTATSGETGEQDSVLVTVEHAVGGAGNDTLVGSASANVLAGGGGNDSLAGGAGNDTLDGGAGSNSLAGDAGDDRFDQGASALGADTLAGGAGVDTVDYSARQSAVTIVMDGTTVGGELGEGDRIGLDVEAAISGAGDDSLTGNPTDNQLEGGAGTDALFGLAGDDILDGGADQDALDCGSGDADIAIDSTTSSIANCEL